MFGIKNTVMWMLSALVLLLILAACGRSTFTSVPPTSEEAMIKPDSESMPLSNATPGTETPGSAISESSEGVIVIQGIFDPAGEELLKLGPIRRYSWTWEESPFEPEGYFVVEVTQVTGEVTTVKFDALVADDSDPGTARHGFFEVYVPAKGEIASIRITDASGEKVFAHINGSEIPP